MDNPTLPELVDNLVKDKGLNLKDASQAVYTLWKNGGLDLSEPNPPSSFFSFAANLESMWFWLLTATVAFTMLLVFGVQSSLLLYARYVMGGLFVLFLPGAMLINALYPKAGELDGLERVALSIGLSLAIVPLVGLILNYTPWGITLTPIMVSLAFFTEMLGLAALVRKYKYFELGLK